MIVIDDKNRRNMCFVWNLPMTCGRYLQWVCYDKNVCISAIYNIFGSVIHCFSLNIKVKLFCHQWNLQVLLFHCFLTNRNTRFPVKLQFTQNPLHRKLFVTSFHGDTSIATPFWNFGNSRCLMLLFLRHFCNLTTSIRCI